MSAPLLVSCFAETPYWGSEHFYGREAFKREEFGALAEALKGLRGRFILSINDVPEVRELFGWATIEPVELTYFLPGKGGQAGARDLIISGRGAP